MTRGAPCCTRSCTRNRCSRFSAAAAASSPSQSGARASRTLHANQAATARTACAASNALGQPHQPSRSNTHQNTYRASKRCSAQQQASPPYVQSHMRAHPDGTFGGGPVGVAAPLASAGRTLRSTTWRSSLRCACCSRWSTRRAGRALLCHAPACARQRRAGRASRRATRSTTIRAAPPAPGAPRAPTRMCALAVPRRASCPTTSSAVCAGCTRLPRQRSTRPSSAPTAWEPRCTAAAHLRS